MNDNLFIASLFPDKHGIKVLELGTGDGNSAIDFGEAIKSKGGQVVTLDISPTAGSKITDDYNDVVHFENSDLFIRAKETEDNFFDVIYFDAVYSYPKCKYMLALWLPKIKKGGIAIGHGADFYWSSLTEALKEQMNELLLNNGDNVIKVPITEELKSCLVLKKEWGLVSPYWNLMRLELHASLAKSLWEVFQDDYNIDAEHTVWWKSIK